MSETLWPTRIFPTASDDAIKGWINQLPIRKTYSSAPAKRLRPSSPHISQFTPPLRSLICTRHNCWRWSQNMRARFKTAPPKRDQAISQTEKRLLAQECVEILPGALRSVQGGGLASSPDVSAYRLSPRTGDRLHAGYRVECETSGLESLICETCCDQIKFSDSGSFLRALIPFPLSTRTRSGRHSEALNTAGSLLTDNRVPLRAMV
jgi:hypothetical protein